MIPSMRKALEVLEGSGEVTTVEFMRLYWPYCVPDPSLEGPVLRVLNTLLKRGYAEERITYWAPRRRTRRYWITEAGRAALQKEKKRWPEGRSASAMRR